MHGWETRMLLKHYLERGVSKAALARRFGVSRRTLHEWIESGQLDRALSSGGARYSPRPPVPHKLDPYAGIIDSRLEAAAVLAASRRLLGAMLRPLDEHRMWVFSDPHFGHEASVGIFGRPFRSCHHGDSYLLEQWTHDVQDHDTVICLGDITMDRPTDGLIDRLRRRPGRKILVAGNHDNAYIRRLRRAFDQVAACAHLAGEPQLLFTHVPLDDIPAGCVNVHGHVHLKTSVDERRINVCVEQIGYELIPMADVRRLARRLDRASLGGNATTDLFIAWAKGWPDAGRAVGQGDAR